MSEFEDNGTVEVAYPKNHILQIFVTLIVGLWIGGVCGVGFSFGRLEDISRVRQPTIIEGNVTIESNDKPVTLTNMNIEVRDTVRFNSYYPKDRQYQMYFDKK
jgi:hypothetical protein